MEDKSLVRVSNILNLTRQEFTVIEKHIIHLVLHQLKQNQGMNINVHDNELPLKVYINAGDVLGNSKNTDTLKDAIRKITKRNIFFNASKGNDENFGSVSPIPYANYIAKQGQKAQILIEIHHTCKGMFLELAQGYTSLLVEAILNLKSEYSIRMYELMSMHLNQKEWTIPLDKLKYLLNISETRFKSFTDFEKRILLYSQKELWEHCGIFFAWKIAKREGKKITVLTFEIKTKEKQENLNLKEDIKEVVDYISTLSPADISQMANTVSRNYTLLPKQVEYIISNRDVFNEFIRIHLIIESMISKGTAPNDRTKYLASSLKLDKLKTNK